MSKSKYEYFIERIDPLDFVIRPLQKDKRAADEPDYFNLDYFGGEPMQTVCNLAVNGRIIAETATMQGSNTAGKPQTTLIVTADGKAKMLRTSRLTGIKDLLYAIGGVPFMIDGREVSLSRDIKAEGWSGGNFYPTWHGFLTLQAGQIWYIAANIGHENDVTATTVIWHFLHDIGASGTVIKLDGGGSFIYKQQGRIIAATEGNRRINYIGCIDRHAAVQGNNAGQGGNTAASTAPTAGLMSEHTPSPWAASSWQKAVQAGIIDGTCPQANVTCEQLMTVFDRLRLLPPQ